MAERSWVMLTAALAAAAATFVATEAHATICRSDTDCLTTPDTPACNKQGSDPTGVCSQCSGDNVTRCGVVGVTRTPVCLTEYGICGCTSDLSCGGGGETSGLVCTRPAPARDSPPYCTAGCVNDGDGGRNGCPSVGLGGAACSATTPPNVGQCVHDCLGTSVLCLNAGPRKLCQLITGPAPTTRCVECLDDTACDVTKNGARVCDPDTHSCVQCNNDDDCTRFPTGNGPRCRPGRSFERSCGCTDDSDCTAIAGRICNDTIKACVSGCRAGSGPGNTCPTGTRCNATGGNTGQCVPIDDGGTADAGDSGSTSDGAADDGSTGDGSTGDDGSAGDSGGIVDTGAPDSGGTRPDSGTSKDAGTNKDAGNDGNDGTSLEGGGCSCSVLPEEDALPIGGLVAVGGFFAFFTRRRAKASKNRETAKKNDPR